MNKWTVIIVGVLVFLGVVYYIENIEIEEQKPYDAWNPPDWYPQVSPNFSGILDVVPSFNESQRGHITFYNESSIIDEFDIYINLSYYEEIR